MIEGQQQWEMPPMPEGEPRPEFQDAGIQCRDYGSKREVWRCDYRKDAFTDPSGVSHWGYVVYEQVVVWVIAREDYHDGYNNNPDAAVIAVDERGRRFRYTPNTVDYVGRGSWTRIDENGEWLRNVDGDGHWQVPPYIPKDAAGPKGYFRPDGSAPVEPVL